MIDCHICPILKIAYTPTLSLRQIILNNYEKFEVYTTPKSNQERCQNMHRVIISYIPVLKRNRRNHHQK